jgi:uncharacterized protein (DUF486 family)
MPFTASHIAAIVPIYARLGRFRVASALVIGSMTPDFHYFLPMEIGRLTTHSVWGLMAFCVPIGLAAYVLYHLLFKHALIALLPDWVADRLDRVAGDPGSLSNARWHAVIGAIAIGAATHIVWDAFTHRASWGVALFPALQDHIASIYGHDLHVYALLQHLSTVVGLAMIAGWSWRWLRREPPLLAEQRLRLTPRAKRFVWLLITATACINGLTVLLPYLLSASVINLGTWPAFGLVTSTIAGGLCALTVFSIVWVFCRPSRVKGIVWLGR